MAAYRIGPGLLLGDVRLLVGRPWSAVGIRDVHPGGILFTVGYGIELGKS